MYSIFKILLVLKLTLILLILTAGMGIVSKVPVNMENVRFDVYHSMEYTPNEQKIIENDKTIPDKKKMDAAEPVLQSCPNKRSLSDLGIYIEL